MTQRLFLGLLLSLMIFATGCNPLSFLYQLHAANQEILNQNPSDPPPDLTVEPSVYVAPDPNNGMLVSGLPYNPGANPGQQMLFGKWAVDVIKQKVNNSNGRRMTMKGKTIIIEPGGNYMQGQPVMSGEYMEDYGTEYVSPEFFRNWYEEATPGHSLDEVENAFNNAFQNPQNANLSQLTCEHSGITEGDWEYHMLPYVDDDGNVQSPILYIDFIQKGDAALSSKCGYNFNNEGAFQIESSGWRSTPIGEDNLYDGPFNISYPYYMDSNFDTVILENAIWQITMTRVQ